MIKFKYAIYKETGDVIKYEDWLSALNSCSTFRFIENNPEKPKYIYTNNPLDVLYGDSFEIIYDIGVTVEELEDVVDTALYSSYNDDKSLEKVQDIIIARKALESKYNIRL